MTRKTLALGIAITALCGVLLVQLGSDRSASAHSNGLLPIGAVSESHLEEHLPPGAELPHRTPAARTSERPSTGDLSESTRISLEEMEASARDEVEPGPPPTGTVEGRTFIGDQPAEGVRISYQVMRGTAWSTKMSKTDTAPKSGHFSTGSYGWGSSKSLPGTTRGMELSV